jgi:hypothetical protein
MECALAAKADVSGKTVAARHAGSILALSAHEKAAFNRGRPFHFYAGMDAGMDNDKVTNKIARAIHPSRNSAIRFNEAMGDRSHRDMASRPGRIVEGKEAG